jgi:hypothetical protein
MYTTFWYGNPIGREYFGDLGVDARMPIHTVKRL